MEKINDETLLNLVKVTNNIEMIYFNLINLEITGMKNTDDWNKQLEYLSLCQEYERKLYNNISITPENYQNYYSRLKALILRDELYSQHILPQEEDINFLEKDRSLTRILNTFKSQLYLNPFYPRQLLDENNEYYLMYDLDEMNEAINFNINLDYLKTLLYLIEKELTNPDNEFIKIFLTLEKYTSIFMQNMDYLLTQELKLIDNKNRLQVFGYTLEDIEVNYLNYCLNNIYPHLDALINSYNENPLKQEIDLFTATLYLKCDLLMYENIDKEFINNQDNGNIDMIKYINNTLNFVLDPTKKQLIKNILEETPNLDKEVKQRILNDKKKNT